MPISGKFLGETKGNRTVGCNVSNPHGGSGESHSKVSEGKFVGKTKGNRDLPPERTSGVSSGPNSKNT